MIIFLFSINVKFKSQFYEMALNLKTVVCTTVKFYIRHKASGKDIKFYI